LTEEGYDESPYAREVANLIKSDHFEKIVTPDHMEYLLPKLAWHYDEPFADSSAVPTYYISNVIRNHVTVALSGDGGDEVFGGYQRYGDIVKYDMDFKSANVVQKTIRSGMKMAGAILPHGFVWKNYLNYKTIDPVKRYYSMVNIFSSDQVKRLLPALSVSTYRSDIFSQYAGTESGNEFLSKIQNIDMHTYLPENNLTKVDRASMANSIEVRVPLLDHKLIELLVQTPSALRMKDFDKKYLLKSVMLKHLPKEVLYRRKRGFSLPMKDWFRNNQAFSNLATNTIFKNDLIREYFDAPYIYRMINEHMHTAKNHSSRLWSLFFLSVWYDDYFKKI
jgi:asparagine synthase (glutamine-hydrolysing)